MKLVHKDFDFVFQLKENKQGLLVVESPCLFRELVKDLFGNEDTRFVLSENNSVIDIKKNSVCVVDFFNVSLNERKILSKLNEIIKNEVLNSELLLKCNDLCGKIEAFAVEVSQNMDFALEYNKNMDLSALIKFIDFRFKQEQVDIMEQLVDYMKINSEVLKINLFLFVNLMSYFNENEVNKIIEFVNYQKMNVLMIENKVPDNLDNFQIVYVLDKDCCQICLKDV